MLPKRLAFTKLCPASTLHSLESCKTCKSYSESGHSNPKSAKLLSGLAQELQAEINQEFLEDLHQLELDDCKVRQAREKELRDPDDVFIQSEERKKQLAKQRKKR
jgi:hypothetical protein